LIHNWKNDQNEEISSTYKICDLNSGVIYSIFLMERKFHLLNEPKVEKDYELFSEYFMKIHYYGTIRLGENEFNYIITNAYNNHKSIPNLTNDQKYKFLINNLSFLDKLQKNNMIHTNYNIENVGYDDEMNIVMTNYDLQTILKIEEGSHILKHRNILKFRIELVLKFINEYTIIPNYVEKNNISLEQLDKRIKSLYLVENDLKNNKKALKDYEADNKYLLS
jgi:hypothetical protein